MPAVLVRLLIFSIALTMCRPTVSAQETPLKAPEAEVPAPAETPPKAETPQDRLTLEAATKELEAFQKLEGQEALKEKAVPLLSQIVKLLQDEEALKKEAQGFKIDPEQIARDVDALKKTLESRNEDPEAAIAAMKESEAIRQELTREQQKFSQLQSDLDQLTLRIENREKRRGLIPTEKTAVEKRLEELKQPVVNPNPNDPPELLPLRQMLARAEQQMLLQQREKLNLEPAYYDANSELRSLQRQILQRDKGASQRRIDLLQKRLADVIKQEARASADQAQQAIFDVPEELRPLADEVAALARQRTASDSPLNESSKLKRLHEETESLLTKWTAERVATEKRIQNTLKNVTIGPIIDEQRIRLPNVLQYERRILQHTRDATAAREEKQKLDEQIDELASIDDEVEQILQELDLDDADWLEDDIRELLGKKREFLTSLSTDYETLRDLANTLAVKETDFAKFIVDYQEYLNSVSMWVPVSGVFGIGDLGHAIESIPVCFQPSDWRDLGLALRDEVQQRPINFFVFAIALLAFLTLHSRLKRQLNAASQEVSQGYLANFSFTWEAFLLSMVLACWIPLLIGVVGYRLSSDTRGTGFVAGVGDSLMGCALLIGILRVIQYLVRGNGLGPVHFRWSKDRCASVRMQLHWYTLIVVPLAFFSTLVGSIGDSGVHDSLGRLLLMVDLLLASYFLFKILAPIKPQDERMSVPKLSLMQKLTVYGPPAIPLVLAMMTFAGYTYTAIVLTKRLMFSVAVLLILTIINETLSRWIYIARGRLALEQARKRQEAREAEEAARAEGKGETSEAPKSFDPKSAGIDLSQVNAQTRQLLTTTFRLAVFVALWLIWSDVMPRIGVLDQPLWQTDQLVESAAKIGLPGTGTSDAPSAPVGQINRWITLGDVFLFILILVVTSIASKNLPGLLEITILQNLPLDTGIRYAAGMLARYCLVAIGLIVATGFLGIGFSQVSILLGGLAVGLGFGLQELFANFVSGIILLFEQPLRIGDIVTVGEVSGTVTRIRIRATTITDWDRKEYIVPNKQFITGQFMNWTLTDSVNRIQIAVGVAYGADTERARNLLLRVAERHPLVLEDPAPSAVFDAFGASSLNLTLRCFLPNLDNRLAVIHDLHTGIDREFKRAGLEIAFPQLDLHLRTVDRGLEPIPVQHSNGVPAVEEKT